MAHNSLIQRLIILFGEPDSANPEKFVEEYAKLTNHFSARVLAKAGDRLVAAGGRKWPTPKSCLEACTDAQETVHGRPDDSNHNMPWEVARREAHKWANDYCDRTSLGKQAAAEGWRSDLFYYAVSYARNCPPDKTLQSMVDWRPPHDMIENFRRGIGRAA